MEPEVIPETEETTEEIAAETAEEITKEAKPQASADAPEQPAAEEEPVPEEPAVQIPVETPEYIPVRRERRPPRKKKHPVLRALGMLLIFLGGMFCGYQLRDLDVTLNVELTVENRTANLSLDHHPEPEPDGVPEDPATEPTEESTDPNMAEVSGAELPWNLVLVNPWNPIDGDYSMELTELGNGQRVDARCYEDLQQMLRDCRAAGLGPVVCSAYRSVERQTTLYNRKVNALMDQGMTRKAAEAKAATIVAVPGTSEHHLGLAVDIVDKAYQQLDTAQEQTAVQKWLMEHCWEYGFILRYPNGSTEITGIIYEPWHYRYVGREAAMEIHELGVTLEEYLEQLSIEE